MIQTGSWPWVWNTQGVGNNSIGPHVGFGAIIGADIITPSETAIVVAAMPHEGIGVRSVDGPALTLTYHAPNEGEPKS